MAQRLRLFSMQAPRQPPAADELEAASEFVTGEAATSETSQDSIPEAPVQAQETEPEPEPEPQPVAAATPEESQQAAAPEHLESEPEAEPAVEPQPAASPAGNNGQESTVNIEGTPVSLCSPALFSRFALLCKALCLESDCAAHGGHLDRLLGTVVLSKLGCA